MGLPTQQVDRIQAAAELHDVGKLFVPRDILDHPGPLTKEQWTELRHHPRVGYDLVRDRVPEEVALVVLTHHERFDGTGYPNAVAGKHIPFEARILQVADAVDAITSVRPYQPAYPVQYAINEMIRCSGTQFDPSVVEAIVELAGSMQWRALRFRDDAELDAELAV
jgi:HD-GYP domain-containing protein (c-di-GMP phosphodiesterase class II)